MRGKSRSPVSSPARESVSVSIAMKTGYWMPMIGNRLTKRVYFCMERAFRVGNYENAHVRGTNAVNCASHGKARNRLRNGGGAELLRCPGDRREIVPAGGARLYLVGRRSGAADLVRSSGSARRNGRMEGSCANRFLDRLRGHGFEPGLLDATRVFCLSWRRSDSRSSPAQ